MTESLLGQNGQPWGHITLGKVGGRRSLPPSAWGLSSLRILWSELRLELSSGSTFMMTS